MIENIDYHIIDACNLNCASCNHFCPLVPSGSDKGKSIEQITSDLNLLSKIGSEFNTLSLLGGEPTLHPQLAKILDIARNIFPDKDIHLISNGVCGHFEEYKEALIRTGVKLYISIYPYCDNHYDRLVSVIECLKPEITVNIVTYPTEIGFTYGFLSQRDDVASEDEIKSCIRRQYCAQLKNGKLYLCNYTAQFDVLKNYFGDNITFDNDDSESGFDLNGVIDINQFRNFMGNAQPNVCRHCLEAHYKYNGINEPMCQWRRTNKDLREWVVD